MVFVDGWRKLHWEVSRRSTRASRYLGTEASASIERYIHIGSRNAILFCSEKLPVGTWHKNTA